MTIRVSEAEAGRELPTLLERVRNGAEVVIERGKEAIAVMRSPEARGRPVGECIERLRAIEKKLGHPIVADPDFAKDVEAAIEAHQEPLEPPAWA